MRTLSPLLAGLMLTGCFNSTAEGPSPSTVTAARYLEAHAIDVSTIGRVSGLIVQGETVTIVGTAGKRVLGSESVVTQWPAPTPSVVAVLRRTGAKPITALGTGSSIRFVLPDGALAGEYLVEGHSIKRLFAMDVDGDGNEEAIATLNDSDEVHCISRIGEQLWAQRWGGDVNYVLPLPTASPTLAHSDGIGLVVRAGDGSVVSRTRPPNAGTIRSVELFHDIATFTGASIGITHQRAGQSAKVDLYTLDGGGARGTLTVADVAPFRSNVALVDGRTTWLMSADVAANGTLTVRAFDDQQAVPGDLDPIHLVAHNKAVIVATGHTARRYEFAQP
jgi:hypothetical protein